MIIKSEGLDSIVVKYDNFSLRTFHYREINTGEKYYIFLVNVFGCSGCWVELNHRNFMQNYNNVYMTIDGYSKDINFKKIYSSQSIGEKDVEKERENIKNSLETSVTQFKDVKFIKKYKIFNKEFYDMVIQPHEYNNLFVAIIEKIYEKNI